MPKKLKFVFSTIPDVSTGYDLPIWTKKGSNVPTPVDMPEYVTVEGARYHVRYHTEIYSDAHQNTQLRGMVIYNFRTIFIDPLQSLPEMKDTLYHEMGHVYLDNWAKKQGPLKKLTPDQEEEFCDLFAHAYQDASPKLQR